MIFKIATCSDPGCKYQQRHSKPLKQLPPCPKCGGEVKYGANWYYSFVHLGKKVIKVGGSTKRFTEDALAKQKLAIRERKYFPDKIPETSWTSATAKFLEQIKANVQPGTYKMYSFGVDKLTPYFKGLTLDQISPADVEAYKRERMAATTKNKKPPAPGTINCELSTIKRICAWALEQQPPLLMRNPLHVVKQLKEGRGRTRFLTEDEIKTLLAHCEAPYLKMAVMIALETGLRKDGVVSLKWSDISDGTITKMVKRGTVVHIPITATLEAALADYRRENAVLSQYVLPSPRNPRHHVRVDSKWRGFRAACKQAEITDFHFHDLRHTFASHFLMRTGDLKTLQTILGHSDLQMTNRYAHLLSAHIKKQMDLFDRTRNGGSPE